MKIDIQLLKKLEPLTRLSKIAVDMLLKQARMRRLKGGSRIFDIGDRSPHSYYLLNGEVDIGSRDGHKSRLVGGSEQARHPFGSLVPRQVSATVASDKAVILLLDRELLEKELTWGLSGERVDFSICDISGADAQNSEWMTSLLHTPVFFRLPMSAVQSLFSKFEAIPCNAGEVIVREGEPGDYYYIIRNGRARVVRQAGGSQITLNHLEAPEGFGDEALISDQPRGATVIMESDGFLMRLAKQDFLDLMKAPAIKRINMRAAHELLQDEKARIIDVRTEAEFEAGHLPDARNIPLYLLYLKSKGFKPGLRYLVYCDTANRSEAATFLLTQRGLDAYLLEDAADALATVGVRETT